MSAVTPRRCALPRFARPSSASGRRVSRAALLAGLLGACVPRLSSDDAEGDLRGFGATWITPDNDWPITPPPSSLVAEGWSEGQVIPEVWGIDQHGDEVSVWQFFGRPLLIDISTLWCAPCQELGRYTEATSQAFADAGLVYVTVIVENEQNAPATQEDLELWASLPAFHRDPDHPYDLITAPIVSDPKGAHGSALAVRNNQYPVAFFVGPDLRVVDRIEPVNHTRIEQVLEEQLGPPSP